MKGTNYSNHHHSMDQKSSAPPTCRMYQHIRSAKSRKISQTSRWVSIGFHAQRRRHVA